MFQDLRQKVLEYFFATLLNEYVEEDNLRSVGSRKISPLNRRAIPLTITATPIVFISNAQKGIAGAVPKGRKGDTSLKISVATCQGFGRFPNSITCPRP